MNLKIKSAERMQEIAEEMISLLNEFKHLAKQSMSGPEYQQFKYRCLGNLEPGLMKESEWITKYSSIDSLEEVAENAVAEAADEEETDEEKTDERSTS